MDQIKTWFYNTKSEDHESDLMGVLYRLENHFLGTDKIKTEILADLVSASTTTDAMRKLGKISDDLYIQGGMQKIDYSQQSPKDGDFGVYKDNRIYFVYFDGAWWTRCSGGPQAVNSNINMSEKNPFSMEKMVRHGWRFKGA